MAWSILPQETKHGETLCKCIRLYPKKDEETGVTKFGRLRFPSLQIVLVSSKGARLVLKAIARGGINRLTFKIQYPPKKGRATFWIGQGRQRRQITDVFAPLVDLPGEEDNFSSAGLFEAELRRRFGEVITDQITQLFSEGYAEIVAAA